MTTPPSVPPPSVPPPSVTIAAGVVRVHGRPLARLDGRTLYLARSISDRMLASIVDAIGFAPYVVSGAEGREGCAWA